MAPSCGHVAGRYSGGWEVLGGRVGGAAKKNPNKTKNCVSCFFADLLDKMLLILLGVLILHLIILILLTVATSASVSVSPQFFRLKKMKEKNVH